MSTMKVKDLYNSVVDGKIISDIELQRAILYDITKQELVIDSIITGIPLPAFYLWKNDDGILEVLDGKQRIEAIKKFKQGNLKYNGKTWKAYAYDTDIQTIFDNTELTIIVCSGTEEMKREIFKRINTLGVPLSKYEVLNGLYHGAYLEGLSDYFAYDATIRKILPNETIDRGNNKYRLLEYIFYIRHNNVFPKKSDLDEYVALRKETSFNEDLKKIRPYLSFIKDVFSDKSKINSTLKFKLAVKHIKERTIWLQHRDAIWKECNAFLKSDGYKLSQSKEADIEAMILGIVGNLKVDPKRLFTEYDKKQLLSKMVADENNMYECNECHQHFREDELTIDHIKPWSMGGRTILSNAQLLCRPCNSRLGNKTK